MVDPHQFWQDLRKKNSIAWSNKINAHLVLTHQTACKLISHPQLSTSIYSKVKPVPLPIRSSFELPAEENKEFRKLIHECFNKYVLPIKLIQKSCIKHIDALLDRVCDFVTEFSVPLSRSLTSKLLGVSDSECEKLEKLLCIASENSGIQQQAAGEIVVERLLKAIESKKNSVETSLFDQLITLWKKNNHDPLNLVSYIAQIIYSLTQRTANQLTTNAVLAFTQWPALQAEIYDGGYELAQKAANESARCEPINQAIPRVATSQFVIDNYTTKENDLVLIVLSSVCRDEKYFSFPHRFILDRKERSLAFGRGVHTCLGGDISLLSAAIAIDEIIKRSIITLSENCSFFTDIGRVCTRLPVLVSSRR